MDRDADDTPTFRELTEAILEVHGPGDREFQWFWSDVYDGRAWRALPEFWKALRARNPTGSVREVVAAWPESEMRALYRPLLWGPEMTSEERVTQYRDDGALIEAAATQGVNLHKVTGGWKVGLTVKPDPLTIENTRQVDTFLSGGRIRLADGREFKRVMTTEEARRVFGLEGEPASE